MNELQLNVQSSDLFKFYKNTVLRHSWLFIAILIALLAFFSFHAKSYRVDASADSLVLEGDEDLDFFREIVKRFGAQEFLIIAYQPKGSLLADNSLQALDGLVADLSTVEGVDSVLSLLDVPLLYSPKVAVSSLGSGIKTLRDDVDKNLVEKELRDSPIYKQMLSSFDGSTAALQINLTRDQKYTELLVQRESLRKLQSEGIFTGEQKQQLATVEAAFKDYSLVTAENQKKLVADVRTVVARYKSGSATMFLGGVPMIANDMVSFVEKDLQIFGLGILVFIIVLLTIIFRSMRWVVLPLLACLITNVFMLGFLGWVDWRMTVISSNFVAMLLIITLAIAVHLVVRFRELQQQFPDMPSNELAAMSATLMFRPCIYTALTTIIAFMSLVISGIRPIIDFGWMMTLGVCVALITTFLVVPIGMTLGRVSKPDITVRDGNEQVFTYKFAIFTRRYGAAILIVALAAFLFSVSGILKLKVENRFIDYFDEKTEIYQGMELIDEKLGGTIPLDVILFPKALEADAAFKVGSSVEVSEDWEVDEEFDDLTDSDGFDDDFDDKLTDESNVIPDWFTRSGLDKVAKIHNHLDGLDATGKVLSLATIYEISRDLLGGSVDDIQLAFAYSGLPDDIRSTMISPYLHAESGETRINVRVKETSRMLNRNELLASLHQFMQDDLGYEADEYRFTGMLVLYNNMLQSLFKSQILTLGVVFIAITIMLAILFKSITLALIGIVPNMLAALLVLGGMGWAGLPLDMMTITIAAISIGIGVDNTIHYVHRFKQEFPNDRDYLATMFRCHGSIGRAMYYTSITIIFGFSILMLSNFKPSIYFGLLTGLAMFSALMGSLLLLPRLLILLKPLGREA